MLIKALQTFTAYDGGEMKVFNAGKTGEVSDALAEQYIDAGIAVAAKGKAKSSDDGAAPAETPAAPASEDAPA